MASVTAVRSVDASSDLAGARAPDGVSDARAFLTPVFVAIVWILMTASAAAFIWQYSSSIPFWDDLEMARWAVPGERLSLAWLWAPHNEHRIPLAKLIYVALLRATGDLRSVSYFDVAVLSAVSLALILVARRVRGRTSTTDAFFPLLLLHSGNATNLLMGFQITFVLPIAIACVVLVLVATGPPIPTLLRFAAITACLVGLTFNGGAGVTQVPPLAAWLAVAGVVAARSTNRRTRSAGRAALGLAAGALILAAVYFAGLPMRQGMHPTADAGSFLLTTSQVLVLSIGPAANTYWPFSAIVVALLVASTLALLARTFRRVAAERVRALGLLACVAASVFLACGIAWARTNGINETIGFTNRYVMLTAPLLCAVYLAWTRYGAPLPERAVRFVLYSIVLVLVFFNASAGEVIGRRRQFDAASIARDVRRGLTNEQIVARHGGTLYPNQQGGLERLDVLRAAGLPPFAARSARSELAPAYPMFRTQPTSVEHADEFLERRADGKLVLLVTSDGELRFALPPGAHRLRGQFGIHPDAVRTGKSHAVRFTVEEQGRDAPRLLFGCLLDPLAQPEDRGFQALAVDLPQPTNESVELVLRAYDPDDPECRHDGPFWTDLEIE